MANLYLRRWASLLTLCWFAGTMALPGGISAQESDSDFHVVVMDPLSDKLACDCVQGYAQRKYQYLGEHLEKHLGRKVHIYWGDSVATAMEDLPEGSVPELVIGKHSVVAAELAGKNWSFSPAASLTGLDGSTSQTGLIVVRKEAPALTVADLVGYRIFFGPANCDEKSAAPMALLREFEIEVADEPETCSACSKAASELMALPAEEKAAAVISSYAAPLLEGCGTIKKGDLRVIGESDPVPFISVFVSDKVSPAIREKLESGLFSVNGSPDLLKQLETRDGFVPFRSAPAGGEGAGSGETGPPSVSRSSQDESVTEKKS
jgi:ABC-type phosphate/phosphonate transport system substrate-binding protein